MIGPMTITPVEHELTRYWVSSATRRGVQHLVDSDYEGGWACSCHDHQCRERECKHIRAVRAAVERGWKMENSKRRHEI